MFRRCFAVKKCFLKKVVFVFCASAFSQCLRSTNTLMLGQGGLPSSSGGPRCPRGLSWSSWRCPRRPWWGFGPLQGPTLQDDEEEAPPDWGDEDPEAVVCQCLQALGWGWLEASDVFRWKPRTWRWQQTAWWDDCRHCQKALAKMTKTTFSK